MQKELICPVVHLNGTGKDGLMRQYKEAYSAALAAQAKINLIETHDRDYYVHSTPHAGRIAREKKQEWLRMLAHVLEELQEIAIAIQKGETMSTFESTIPEVSR